MQSATSFFNRALFRKNLQRFWPLWFGYVLIWLLLLPLPLLNELADYHGVPTVADASYYLLQIGAYGGTVTREMLAQELQQEIAGKAEQSAVQASLSALSGSFTDIMQSTVEAMNAADAETNARVDQLFVFGTYEGDGETSQFISLGFTPRAVLICRTDGAFSQANLIYGGLATAASPAKTVEIAENGFNVLSSSSLYNGNNPMYTFKYIALR